jgi:endoribonuclease Dicer
LCVGDTVLGWIIALYIYNREDNFDPGKLSSLKGELVNNQFLAVAAHNIGLTGCIIHMNPTLASTLSEFGAELKNLLSRMMIAHKLELTGIHLVNQDDLTIQSKSNEARTYTGHLLVWHDQPPCPKAAGDVLESVIGAIYLDSKCDLTVCETVLKKIILDPWFPLFIKAGVDRSGDDFQSGLVGIVNPVSELYGLASSGQCRAIEIK